MAGVGREPGFRIHRDDDKPKPIYDEWQSPVADKTECAEAQVAGKYAAAWIFTVTVAFVAYVLHLVFGG